MYQVSVNNTEKKVKKGEYLKFTIANFPPEYHSRLQHRTTQ